MDCGEFSMICGVMTVVIMLAYLNCHVYILFVMVFSLVGQLVPGNDLHLCLQPLVVADYYYYYC